MAEEVTVQSVSVWLYCDNRDEDHRATLDESFYCLPGAAAGAAADAEVELHKRARAAGWLIEEVSQVDHDLSCPRLQAWDSPEAPCTCPPGWPRRAKTWRVLCPGCAAQAGGGE